MTDDTRPDSADVTPAFGPDLDGDGLPDPLDVIDARLADADVAEADAVTARQQAAAATGVATRAQWLYQRSVFVAALVALMVAGSVGVVTLYLVGRVQAVETRSALVEEQARQLRELAQGAAADARTANQQLAALGQAPVPVPDPDRADPSEVLVASATARVLADLAESGASRPTPEQLGAGIAEYLRQNPITPVGPTSLQLAEALAGYFATSPPPAGPAGPTGPTGPTGPAGPTGVPGEPGATPTAEQIQAAFRDLLAREPDVLCPRGGLFALVEGAMTVTGAQYSHWTCLVESVDPTPTPTLPPTASPPGVTTTPRLPTVPPQLPKAPTVDVPSLPTR